MTYPDVLVVEVTAGDIDKGIPYKCASCPIALAASRALGVPVEADAEGLYHPADRMSDSRYKYATPVVGYQFMSRFDRGMDVKPRRFRFKRLA